MKIRYCDICEEEHLEVRTEEVVGTVKGEKVSYITEYAFCPELEEEFEDEKMIEDNLFRMRDAYRKKMKLLRVQEIIELRKEYGLTQKDLAIILGMGEVSITRIEKKVIQDRTTDDAIKRIKEDPAFFLEKLELVKDKLTEKKYKKILSKLDETLEVCTYRNRIIEVEYFNNEPNLVGNIDLNLDKISNMIIYFLENCEKVYKTKLNKLLFYADFNTYRKIDKGISGLLYNHLPFGAVPKGINEILSCLNGIEVEEKEDIDSGYTYFKIKALNSFNNNLFNEVEIKSLEEVAKKFKKFGNKEISEYMHKEVAYLKTNDREPIDYKYGKDLMIF